MSEIKQKKENLEKYLNEQMELLELLGEAYDSGKTVAAKQIATVVRVLVHDTSKSHSLLSQLGLKSGKFFDSCTSGDGAVDEGEGKRMGSFAGIVGMAIGPNGSFTPYLDDIPGKEFEYVAFKDYWERIVLIDSNGSQFSRRKLICTVANQDGGAHVGPVIDEKYAALVRENTMGWTIDKGDGVERGLDGIELATTRQIGHEILRTLNKNLPHQKMKINGAAMVVGGMGIWAGKAVSKIKTSLVSRSVPKVGRNEKCPCKSGLKYKKCHGR